MKGIREIPEANREYQKDGTEGASIDPKVLEKYDRLMGDNIKRGERSDNQSLSPGQEHGSSPEERKNKLAKLFEEGDFFQKPQGEETDSREGQPEDQPEDQKEEAASDNGEASPEEDESGEKRGLTKEEKAKIKEQTGWSDEIIDAIGSMKEAEIYMKAGLKEAEINGKKCLIRDDIDWNQKDEMGRTNEERARQGLPPITKDGKTIELHHIGQHADSPLAELTPEEHRGKGNDSVLHDKTKESEIDRLAFAGERSSHWEARAGEGGNT